MTITVPGASDALNNALNTLAIGSDADAAAAQNLAGFLNNDPQEVANLNSAFAAGSLTGFNFNAPQGTGAAYASSFDLSTNVISGTIELDVNTIKALTDNPTDNLNFAFEIGHETSHALVPGPPASSFGSEITALPISNGFVAADSVILDALDAASASEDAANLAGMNNALYYLADNSPNGAVVAASNLMNLPESEFYFGQYFGTPGSGSYANGFVTISTPTTVTIGGNSVIIAQGSLLDMSGAADTVGSPLSSNLATEAPFYFHNNGVEVGPYGEETYSNFYAAPIVEELLSYASQKSATLSLNFAADGLSVEGLTRAMTLYGGPANEGGQGTVIDTSTNLPIVLSWAVGGGGATATEQLADGSYQVYAAGVGTVVAVGNAVVTVEPNSSTLIDASGDTVTLEDTESAISANLPAATAVNSTGEQNTYTTNISGLAPGANPTSTVTVTGSAAISNGLSTSGDAQLTLNGANVNATLAAGSSMAVTQSGDTVTMQDGSNVDTSGGAPITVTLTCGTTPAGAPNQLTITGTDETSTTCSIGSAGVGDLTSYVSNSDVIMTSGGSVTLIGNGNNTDAGADSTITQIGSNNVTTMSSGTTVIAEDGSGGYDQTFIGPNGQSEVTFAAIGATTTTFRADASGDGSFEIGNENSTVEVLPLPGTVVSVNGQPYIPDPDSEPSPVPLPPDPDSADYKIPLTDPLAIDLTGNGVNLLPISANSPEFDFTGNDLPTQVGWIGAGTGFLAVQSANGQITPLDLFGPGSASGFAALQALDANGDGVISALDPNFSSLVVWQDLNGDGVAEPGEVESLSQLGVTSISLASTPVDKNINGNIVESASTATTASGGTLEVADVAFATPNPPAYAGPFDSNPTTAALPEVEGYGDLVDLRSAMTADPALQALVTNFLSATTNSVSAIDSAVQAIAYEWAGATNIASDSRGSLFDAQKLRVLEQFNAQPFAAWGFSNPEYADQAQLLATAYAAFIDSVEARLIVQDPSSPISGLFSYDVTTDSISPTGSLVAAVSALQAAEPTDPEASQSYWAEALNVIANVSASARMSVDAEWQVEDALFINAPSQFSLPIEAAAADGALAVISARPGNAAAPNSNVVLGPGGIDLFTYDAGDGSVSISESNQTGHQSDSELLLGGVSLQNLVVSIDTQGDIILGDGSPGDQITLQGELATNAAGATAHGVQEVALSDGTVLDRQQLMTLADTGSPSKTKLYGWGGPDIFDSKGYATYEQGNGGTDTFLYNIGYGSLEINEDSGGLSDSPAVVRFGAGVSASNISVRSDSSGDLLITDGVAGDEIKLDNELGASPWGHASYGLAAVDFSDGTSLSRRQLITLADTGSPTNTTLFGSSGADVFDSKGYATYAQGNGGPDVFLYNAGYGSFEINDSSGGPVDSSASLEFGAGFNAGNISVTSDSAGDLFISDGTAGDQIKLDNELASDPWGHAEYGVATVAFSDGTSLTREQLVTLADTGSPTNTKLYGSTSADTFDSKAYATYEQGNGGSDSFIYNVGYGSLEINEDAGYASSTTSVLLFGAGINATSLTVTEDSAGDVTIQDGVTGDSIKIDREMAPGLRGQFEYGVAELEFSDGSTLSRSDLLNLLTTGMPGRTSLYGTSGADFFDSRGYANYEQGNGGADVFFYSAGYGKLQINEDVGMFSYTAGTLQFSSEILPNALTITSDSAGDMILYDGTKGDRIVIDGQFAVGDRGTHEWGVNSIVFADGTSWSYSQLAAIIQGSNGGLSLNIGSGSATYDEAGLGGTQTLNVGAGVTASDLQFQADAAGDLTVIIASTGDSVTFENDLSSQEYGTHSAMSQIRFSDGSTLAVGLNWFNQGSPLTFTWTGTGTNTNLVGSNFGSNIFDLGPGGDTVTAGSSVSNTFEFGKGDGAATVNLNGAGGAVVMGAGITASDLQFQADSAGDLTVIVASTGDSITFKNDLSSQWYGIHSAVTQITFADGSTMPVGMIYNNDGTPLTFTWTGTATNTNLVGTSWGSNIFDLGPGGDTVTSGAGANLIDASGSTGAANVTLTNAGGANTLNFGPAATDESLWFSESGSDLVIDEIGTSNSLTLKNWFSGATYQPQEISASGLNIDSQVAALVSAMASFQSANPAFNPAVATQMPTDATLQAAIVAAWHH